MPGRRRLPQETRWQIIGMNRNGMSCRATVENLNINNSVVSRFVRKHVETGHVRDKPCTGRPKQTSGRDDQALVGRCRSLTVE